MDISHIHSTKSKLSTIPLVHGQVIFITDAQINDNDIYADFLDPVTQNVVRYPLTKKSALFYGICSTAADISAKEVQIENFVLTAGAWAFVKFTYGNTSAAISLNISNTGAKFVKYNGENIGSHLITGVPYQVLYNGTYYEMVNLFDFSPDLDMSVNLTDGHLYYDFSANSV